jgi:enoyl-CoA hydratase/carnithine racemase
VTAKFDGEFVRLTMGAGPDAGVATLSFARPPVNALNRALQEELRAASVAISADGDVRVVVLTGGDSVFAAGADVREFAAWDGAFARDNVGPLQSAFDAVAAIPAPVIAKMSGYALGGGMELAMCADIRIADTSVVLGQPEVLLALIPGAGGTQRLTRLVGSSRAKELVFTGRQVAADEALAWGLVNEVVAPEELGERVVKIAQKLARHSQAALRAAKRAIDVGADMTLREGLHVERTEFAALFAGEDVARGIQSFFDNGPGKADFRTAQPGAQ